MPKLHLPDVELSYRDEGEGPAVLLLHAYPLHGGLFQAQLEALQSHYRLIVPDLRGFGESTSAGAVTEMETYAQDALALLDALQLQSAVVGGVSMGGYIAMALLRLDASRVSGLILCDTQATADDSKAQEGREAAAKAALEGGLSTVADTMVPKLLAAQSQDLCGARVREMILAGSAEGAAAAQRGMARRHDSRELLSRFAGPALVMVGEHDALTPPAKAQQMVECLSRGALKVIPNAGHLAPLEAPNEVSQALTEFLGAI